MNGNQRWFGWIAIGISCLALLVALVGRGFGPQVAAANWSGSNAPQSYTQQDPAQQQTGPQSGPGAPGANAQRGAGAQGIGPQSGSAAPVPGAQLGAAPGADARRGPGRPGDAGFGLGGWLRFPFRLIGGLFQIGMLALLVVLGVWLIRRRSAGGATPGSGRAEPAQGPPQEPQEPAGESSTDEPRDRE
jgi:hypothetical protein